MNTKNYKYLNIKGTILDNYQLQNYMEKIAINYDVKGQSKKNTYPIPRLKDNFKFIEKTYELLNESIKNGVEIHPAGEWLLDNFYIIEETYKTVCLEMNIKKYKEFPGISTGEYKGYARIYVLASEIVAYTDNKINDDILELTISSYQKRKLLNMKEIWNLWIFLEIAIIENIRSVCEKIYSSQIQKYKVENIIERLVEKKEIKNQTYKAIKKDEKIKLSNREMKYPFIEYMSYKLKKYGRQGLPYLEILEEQVNKMGMTIADVIKKEHYDIAISKVYIGNSILSLKEILRVNFLSLFEEINGIEEILKKDPADVYSKMDYKTKDSYRNSIKEISEKTKISEIYIANKVVEVASKYKEKNSKKSHIGYYLISEGKQELLNAIGFKGKKEISYKTKSNIYILAIYTFTTIFTIINGAYLYFRSKSLLISILASIFLCIPISEIVIQVINYILNKSVKPKALPKLDFTKGIPKEYSTFVVIPTIINSKEKVIELIKKLNDKYKNEIYEPSKFYFLYRERVWNEKEECYLGWERKRGLLCQFNEFLVDGINKFKVNTLLNENAEGDSKDQNENLNIKYVITLDSDTNLVLETAFELIGTMAHILNTPVLNKENDAVIEGHGLIQPRIGINLEASRKSLFTKIYAGARRNRFIYKCNI